MTVNFFQEVIWQQFRNETFRDHSNLHSHRFIILFLQLPVVKKLAISCLVCLLLHSSLYEDLSPQSMTSVRANCTDALLLIAAIVVFLQTVHTCGRGKT